MHVGGDLRPPAGGQPKADRAHTRQAAARLAQLGSNAAGELEVVARQVNVERDQRRARTRQQRSRAGVCAPWPEVRCELAGLHPAGKLGRAATPDVPTLGVLGPRGQLAVQEHGQLELIADQSRRCQGLGTGCAALALIAVHDRQHVQRPHVWMKSLVPAQVDPLDRRARAAEQRPRQLALARRQREHRPPVVWIGVQIEHARRRKAPFDPLEHGGMPALADVGDGNEQRGARWHRLVVPLPAEQ